MDCQNPTLTAYAVSFVNILQKNPFLAPSALFFALNKQFESTPLKNNLISGAVISRVINFHNQLTMK